MALSKRKSVYRPAPISDEACQQLSKKYGVAVEQLKQMAKELRFGRPKLEMHLIVLQTEARKKTW
jgi:hypothetical protein